MFVSKSGKHKGMVRKLLHRFGQKRLGNLYRMAGYSTSRWPSGNRTFQQFKKVPPVLCLLNHISRMCVPNGTLMLHTNFLQSRLRASRINCFRGMLTWLSTCLSQRAYSWDALRVTTVVCLTWMLRYSSSPCTFWRWKIVVLVLLIGKGWMKIFEGRVIEFTYLSMDSEIGCDSFYKTMKLNVFESYGSNLLDLEKEFDYRVSLWPEVDDKQRQTLRTRPPRLFALERHG